ncbi:hypothetical protein L195_g010420 [Trifolium pratense]|uniref:Uncharacterized protein n=1 Tax=Trifolium pratense TaxID=57577 RepID=A0A2K3PET7_TRIPR|nr:hypothetical protein L195_g010420 [Trifolium pratense]
MYWEPTSFTKPVPPRVKRSAGRPKKNRRRDATEIPAGSGKVKWTLPDFQCTRCGFLAATKEFPSNPRGGNY